LVQNCSDICEYSGPTLEINAASIVQDSEIPVFHSIKVFQRL
jgi:hypothetical protein